MSKSAHLVVLWLVCKVVLNSFDVITSLLSKTKGRKDFFHAVCCCLIFNQEYWLLMTFFKKKSCTHTFSWEETQLELRFVDLSDCVRLVFYFFKNNLHFLFKLQGVDQKQSAFPAWTKEAGFPRFLPVVPRKSSFNHGAKGEPYW